MISSLESHLPKEAIADLGRNEEEEEEGSSGADLLLLLSQPHSLSLNTQRHSFSVWQDEQLCQPRSRE